MKKFIPLLAATVFLFTACEKIKDLRDEDKPCPVVLAEAVPDAVLKAFEAKHAGVPVKTWFNKDSKGYVAVFDSNGREAQDFFDNSGNFQKEVIEGDGQDDHEDDDEKGCECEVED